MSISRDTFVVFALILSTAMFARAEDSMGLDEESKGTTKKGEITERHQRLVRDAVQIDLKAGQRVELSVTANGNDQEVAIILWDTDGTAVTGSGGIPRARFPPAQLKKWSDLKQKDGRAGDAQTMVVMSRKKATVVIGEVPATGRYTIGVYSDVAVAYVLTAKDLTNIRDVRAIEKELKAAQDRVEELEKELKEARRSKKSP